MDTNIVTNANKTNETNKQNKIYKISEIVHKSLCKNNMYNVILKLNGHLITFGFMGLNPFEGDIIECDLIPRDDHSSYKFNTYKIFLPLGEITQIHRINKILLNENIEYNYNVVVNYFKKFSYGDNFWLNTYKEFTKLNNQNCEYPNDQNMEYLKIVGTHISKYFYSLMQHFKKELETMGVKLSHGQYVELFLHPEFGFPIDKWNVNNLFYLFQIDCFSLKTILNIAYGMNICEDDYLKLIIIYSLNNNYQGSTCIEYSYYKMLDQIMGQKSIEKMFTQIEKKLTEKLFEKIIKELIAENKLILINNYLCTSELFNCEITIGKILNTINRINSIKSKLNLDLDHLISYISNYQIKPKLYLNEQQQKSIIQVFLSNITVTHGKAGTGKSSLLAGLLNVIDNINDNYKNPIGVYFLTPTAKAKMKLHDDILKDYTNYKSNIRTINSFNCTSLNDFKQINLFVIDETSMVDVNLMCSMLKIIVDIPNSSILFLGDIRQLPSIGPGNVLSDIINSNCFPVTELVTVVRNGGVITEVLDKITQGEMLNPSDYKSTPDFRWIIPSDKNYIKYITQSIGFPDCMIITMTNKLIYDLTGHIRKIKNNKESELDSFEYTDKDFNKIILKTGDPVIFSQNFNREGLFNGMSGHIIEIVKSYNVTKMTPIIKIKVQFEDLFFTFDSDSEYIKHLKPAFMITIHKSQGQEYENVTIILPESKLLNRNTLYTGISRAKKSVTLIVGEKILSKAISKKAKRKSLLIDIIRFFYEEIAGKNQIDQIDFINYYKKINTNV